MENTKANILLIFAIGLIIGIWLRGCSDNIPNNLVEPQTKVIKEIEKQTVTLKGEVKTLKQIVEKEDKRKVDSLKRELDSILALQNFDCDTALNICLKTVSAQETVIKRQDTIIHKQDTIIFNDSIVKLNLNQRIVIEKKKARKSMFKGIGIGFVGGILTGVLVKNT